MKKFFEEPSVEVIAFAVEDVITASSSDCEIDLGENNLPFS